MDNAGNTVPDLLSLMGDKISTVVGRWAVITKKYLHYGKI